MSLLLTKINLESIRQEDYNIRDVVLVSDENLLTAGKIDPLFNFPDYLVDVNLDENFGILYGIMRSGKIITISGFVTDTSIKTTDINSEKCYTSIRGTKGLPGKNGQDGLDGSIGLMGSKGDTGSIGPKGDRGQPGLKGDKGDVGPMGSIGFQGVQGDPGDPGPIGRQGITGEVGDKGPMGPKGLKGYQGLQGDKGYMGIKGLMGPQGPQGCKGIDGDKGPKGETGCPPSGVTGPPPKPCVNGKDGKVKKLIPGDCVTITDMGGGVFKIECCSDMVCCSPPNPAYDSYVWVMSDEAGGTYNTGSGENMKTYGTWAADVNLFNSKTPPINKYRAFKIANSSSDAHTGSITGIDPPSPLTPILVKRAGDSVLWANELRNMIPDIDSGAYSGETLYIMVDDSGSMRLTTVKKEIDIFTAMFAGKIKFEVKPQPNEKWVKWITDFFG